MRWQMRRGAGSKGLPHNVSLALAKQFHLDPLITSDWWFLDQSGKFAGRPVRFFRIIDPCLIGRDVKSPPNYSDLEGSNYRNALQFEGYIEKEGYVILRDRRPKPAVASLVRAGAAR